MVRSTQQQWSCPFACCTSLCRQHEGGRRTSLCRLKRPYRIKGFALICEPVFRPFAVDACRAHKHL